MTCQCCHDIFDMLKGAADRDLHFTPQERAEMTRECEKSIAENTLILASRGYTEVNGRWGYHSAPKDIQ